MFFSYTVVHGFMDWERYSQFPTRRPVSTRHHCKICGKSYGHQTSLLHHLKVHSGETTCPICSKVLNRIFDLKMHLNLVHGFDDPSTTE